MILVYLPFWYPRGAKRSSLPLTTSPSSLPSPSPTFPYPLRTPFFPSSPPWPSPLLLSPFYPSLFPSLPPFTSLLSLLPSLICLCLALPRLFFCTWQRGMFGILLRYPSELARMEGYSVGILCIKMRTLLCLFTSSVLGCVRVRRCNFFFGINWDTIFSFYCCYYYYYYCCYYFGNFCQSCLYIQFNLETTTTILIVFGVLTQTFNIRV